MNGSNRYSNGVCIDYEREKIYEDNQVRIEILLGRSGDQWAFGIDYNTKDREAFVYVSTSPQFGTNIHSYNSRDEAKNAAIRCLLTNITPKKTKHPEETVNRWRQIIESSLNPQLNLF